MTMTLTDLRESNEFLNILLENIPSLVLLADNTLRIHEVNDACRNLFGLSREAMVGQRCGNALQCAFAVTEHQQCGETSNCHQCFLQRSALATICKKVPTDKEKLSHTFFINGVPEQRHFEFSTRYIHFHGQEMVLLILYDVTILERQKQILSAQQEEIRESLTAAGWIQKGLLPGMPPESEHVRFAWKFMPCESIGGDILNIIALDEHHVGLYMLDVAGHGPPAAMISMLAYQFLNAHSGILVDCSSPVPRIRDPEEVLNLLNLEFPYMRFERHFTIVYAVLDASQGILTTSNAAHCRPVLLRPGEEPRYMEVSGTIIGLEGIPFGQQTTQLSPGDKVVLLSDGIEEARNGQGDIFGEERLHAALRSMRQAGAQELVEELFSTVTAFAGDHPAPDDITILALDYRMA